jgi:hypothetical protein
MQSLEGLCPLPPQGLAFHAERAAKARAALRVDVKALLQPIKEARLHSVARCHTGAL